MGPVAVLNKLGRHAPGKRWRGVFVKACIEKQVRGIVMSHWPPQNPHALLAVCFASGAGSDIRSARRSVQATVRGAEKGFCFTSDCLKHQLELRTKASLTQADA